MHKTDQSQCLCIPSNALINSNEVQDGTISVTIIKNLFSRIDSEVLSRINSDLKESGLVLNSENIKEASEEGIAGLKFTLRNSDAHQLLKTITIVLNHIIPGTDSTITASSLVDRLNEDGYFFQRYSISPQHKPKFGEYMYVYFGKKYIVKVEEEINYGTLLISINRDDFNKMDQTELQTINSIFSKLGYVISSEPIKSVVGNDRSGFSYSIHKVIGDQILEAILNILSLEQP